MLADKLNLICYAPDISSLCVCGFFSSNGESHGLYSNNLTQQNKLLKSKMKFEIITFF